MVQAVEPFDLMESDLMDFVGVTDEGANVTKTVKTNMRGSNK